MKTTFEPGDGSFEIYLDFADPFPTEWNTSGVVIWRKDENGVYHEVKGYNEVLTGV